MFEEVDKRFDEIKDIFIKNHSSTILIEKAYKTADYLHKDQRRKDGGPYISHPVEVAMILAELGFDENVVSAGLLHDVVEDCGYTIEDIKTNFNLDVATMVDCVSAIDKTKYIFDDEDIYENKDFVKASIEEQSFKKLIAIGKQNPMGFCIKFADRLHNLRTIGIFNYYKQLEKVRETEKWILPIAKILHAGYFYNEIKNECFKISNKYKVAKFLEDYEIYHHSCINHLKNMQVLFQENLSKFNVEVKVEEVKEYKIYEELLHKNKNLNLLNISQGQILRVGNFCCYIIYENNSFKQILNDVVMTINKRLDKIIKIIDVNQDKITKKIYLELEDNIKNKYYLFMMTKNDYLKERVGTIDNQLSDLIDEDNTTNLGAEFIRIQTRSGEIKYIQKESTALDFAFKIHRDIGFGFKNAIINGSKTNFPPYTKLHDGDKVEIIVERDENGIIYNNAELKWLAYVNNDISKKILIKYFQKFIKKED